MVSVLVIALAGADYCVGRVAQVWGEAVGARKPRIFVTDLCP